MVANIVVSRLGVKDDDSKRVVANNVVWLSGFRDGEALVSDGVVWWVCVEE